MSRQSDPLRTCFYDFHVRYNAKIIDFNGWRMPLLYRGIIAEHQQTRRGASIFDVSHMGRLTFSGLGATAFLQHILTRDIGNAAVGQSLYSLVCNPQGGILDDLIVSRFDKHWLLVCNAGNRAKLLEWFAKNSAGFDVRILDNTLATAMVAVQGPKAIELLDALLPEPVSSLKKYHFLSQRYLLAQFTIFRGGYTGEDGVEIICPATLAQMAMGFLFKQGRDLSDAPLRPAGLGARDTLRLEAGLPLYDHELDEQTDPLSAGLEWAVAKNKTFIGSEALAAIARAGPRHRLVGLLVEGARIPRPRMPVRRGGRPVGRITSGTASPTLGRTIAMAYIEQEYAQKGIALEVDIRSHLMPAVVTDLPFYHRGDIEVNKRMDSLPPACATTRGSGVGDMPLPRHESNSQ